jgi:sigma-B regulation protein RsbU (phosphoserine phosphatase)
VDFGVQTIDHLGDVAVSVTLLMAEIDTAHRQLRYVNCGHNPALWLRNNGTTVEQMDSSCPPIGLIPSTVSDIACENLEDGDVLVLYTDGVTEAMNSHEQEFGIDRLSALVRRDSALSAETLVSRIVDAAFQFTEGVGFPRRRHRSC